MKKAKGLNSQSTGNLSELDDIEAALPSFKLGDERLGASQPRGKSRLAEAGVLARSYQQ